MYVRIGLLASLILSISCLTGPARAHHAFAAVFNGQDAVEISGTVVKLEWMNPHAWFYVDVENGNEAKTQWAFEMGSPNGLIRRGWSRKTLRIGQKVKVSGYRAKDGTRMASVKNVVFADDTVLSGASSKGTE